MSELYPVLILKGLGWLLMARFTPHSRADVAYPSGGPRIHTAMAPIVENDA